MSDTNGGAPTGEPPDVPEPSEAPEATDAGSEDDATTRRRRAFPIGAGIFLLVVALLLVVFVWVRPDWFGRSDLGNGDPALKFQKRLVDIGLVDGLRLSDDSSTSQSFTVTFPSDSPVERPQISLVGKATAPTSGVTFLRVLVDGVASYAAQLPVGESDVDATIQVPPSAMEDNSVRVQVRLTGSLDQAHCNVTQELGAFVSLDAQQTQVRGTLGQPIHTVRDLVAIADQQVVLDLAYSGQDADQKAWFETAMRLGTSLTQAGHDVAFVDSEDDAPVADDQTRILVGPADVLADAGWTPVSGEKGALAVGTIDSIPVLGVVEPNSAVVSEVVTTNAVTIADAPRNAPVRTSSEHIPSNAVTLSALGTDTSVQQITSSRSWRTNYSLADLPGGTVPTSVHIEMIVPETSDDARWLVNVQLNGQLLGSLRLPPASGHQAADVAIPSGLEAMRNQLVVTLVRDRDLGGCSVRQTVYQVQLLPTSRLVLGGTGAGFTAVPAAFASGFSVYLPSTTAAAPATALAGLVPTLSEFTGWQQQPDVVWDGTPSDKAFFVFGAAPNGVRTSVAVGDGRLKAQGFDLQSFVNGLVVTTASTDSAEGLVVTAAGSGSAVVPPYGREVARVVGDNGGGFVVGASGTVVTVPPVRTGG